jgi:GntR family transcriptional regulator
MPGIQALFDIQPQLALPIYRQVVEQVQRLVAGGQLAPGDELPSVRAVAERHAINPMTVSKAYSLLEAEGLLERRRGVGMVVAQGVLAASPSADRLALLAPALENAARQAAQLGITVEAALAAFELALRQTPKEEIQP